MAVIQELMETDMHRVIRTQDLSDDHAQVRLSDPDKPRIPGLTMIILVLHLPNPPSPQGSSQR